MIRPLLHIGVVHFAWFGGHPKVSCVALLYFLFSIEPNRKVLIIHASIVAMKDSVQVSDTTGDAAGTDAGQIKKFS
ncbi:MAG: hypothetical protein WKG06_09320 [Segetibacter sp.]